ncbi:hypothetical protein GCM10023187_23940 [Nibrella viscosa]|uniref:histidine kinase n=1 Tax=Nibrella viscosa TaxID=1084524 RepID=A0ABP8KG92_9BACT
MRHVFFMTGLLLLALSAPGQATVDRLPPEGVWLTTGWTFRAGDNPAWAKPDHDDSRWTPVAPAADLAALPLLRTAEMGWFRLRFRLAPDLANGPVTLLLSQIGASEVYLNGRLIHKEGVVSRRPANEQTRFVLHKPVAVSVAGPDEQVLAVRYSLTNATFRFLFPIPIGEPVNPALGLQLQPAADSVRLYAYQEATHAVPVAFIMGYFLVLAVLHLFIYASFRKVKANLYFGLAMVQLAVWRLTLPLLLWAALPVSLHYSLLWVGYAFGAAAGTFIALASYLVFRRQPDWLFRTLVLFWLIVVATLPWNPYTLYVSIAGTFIVMITAARVALLSIGKGNKLGWVYLAGAALWTLLNGLVLWPGLVDEPPAIALIQSAMDMVIPLVISIVLGADYVRANRTLEAKLVEVERLSRQMLAQEQEKQQLLANQNKMLEQQVADRTAQLVAQKEELQQALQTLKATQDQLIQREKMASLGELTAGIAHEIQNPLNFVTNFSDISAELVDELQQELAAGDIKEVSALAEDIRNNLQKICQHGQRAGTIVKNMLQHARSSSGQVEPTDLNALANEYLQIAYQNLKAKDENFSVDLRLQLDPSLGKIELMPQELGQVLLNLYNNAFYAITEKSRQLGTASGDFQPQVGVTTQVVSGPSGSQRVEVRVRDNGTGIPADVLPKIYQPLFTTKSGVYGNTGVGLSLSYDIVTKGHGGDFRVETEPGQFAEFIIQLPIQSVPTPN